MGSFITKINICKAYDRVLRLKILPSQTFLNKQTYGWRSLIKLAGEYNETSQTIQKKLCTTPHIKYQSLSKENKILDIFNPSPTLHKSWNEMNLN